MCIRDRTIDDTLSFMDILEIFDSASKAYMVVDDLDKSSIYSISNITPLYYYHRILTLDDIVYVCGTRTLDGSGGLSADEVRIGSYSFSTDINCLLYTSLQCFSVVEQWQDIW